MSCCNIDTKYSVITDSIEDLDRKKGFSLKNIIKLLEEQSAWPCWNYSLHVEEYKPQIKGKYLGATEQE